MFPSYKNQSVDLQVSIWWLTGFYMMRTLVVKGLMQSSITSYVLADANKTLGIKL